jgi:GTP-binding protein
LQNQGIAKFGEAGSLAATNMTAKPVLNHAQFHTSVAQLRDLPYSRAEIAFAGRSNAGKSSAINLLTRINRLAYTSKTPGRTQLINFFAVDDDTYLVDLPGYGYAKVPPAVKAKWEGLLSRYLQERDALAGMVLIMDARHPLTPLDRQMLDWFTPTGKPVHILLSKADKLSNSEKVLTLRKVKQALDTLDKVSVQLFSSLSRLGADDATILLEDWLSQAQQGKPQSATSLGESDMQKESPDQTKDRG